MEQKVVIIGAGPAGMLLSWLLVSNNIRVTMIERHPDFSREFRGEGIQASVMKHLEDLGLMQAIKDLKMGIPAEAARVFFNERPVAVLKGIKADTNFGIILHQEKFLSYLHNQLSESSLYESYLGHAAKSFEQNNDKIQGVATIDRSNKEHTIRGDIFIVTTGRGTPLRKKLNLKAKKLDTHWDILWILLPKPEDHSLRPKGFRAYLNGESLFIMYTNPEGMLQMAWSKKDDKILKERNFAKKKNTLLSEIPSQYRALVESGYLESTRTQYLKVECDRLHRWHHKNVLFLGDAAHTMSPVAGQGINLAMRDSIVAANHLIRAIEDNNIEFADVFQNIQKERSKEIRIMQKFQQKFGYFMLGAPVWKSKLFFFKLLPILERIGIKKRMLKMVQSGVSKVDFLFPVKKNFSGEGNESRDAH